MSIAQIRPYSGYLGLTPVKRLNQYMLINDRVEEIHNVVVYRFKMGDVEDPILYAAQPLLDWEKSEIGQWVLTHAMESPMWHRQEDPLQWGHQFAITAKLKGKDYTYWQLKFADQVKST